MCVMGNIFGSYMLYYIGWDWLIAVGMLVVIFFTVVSAVIFLFMVCYSPSSTFTVVLIHMPAILCSGGIVLSGVCPACPCVCLCVVCLCKNWKTRSCAIPHSWQWVRGWFTYLSVSLHFGPRSGHFGPVSSRHKPLRSSTFSLARGDPLRISRWSLPLQKLEWFCYLTVKTAWS